MLRWDVFDVFDVSGWFGMEVNECEMMLYCGGMFLEILCGGRCCIVGLGLVDYWCVG